MHVALLAFAGTVAGLFETHGEYRPFGPGYNNGAYPNVSPLIRIQLI